MKIGQSAAKSYAYLLGVFLGDGCVTATGNALRYAQNTIDEDFAEAVRDALSNLTDRRVTVTYQEKPRPNRPCSPQWTVGCSDREICAKLLNDTQGKAVIPAYVFEWSGDLKKEFVIGLMDSEGFVAQVHTNRGYEWEKTNRSFFIGFKSCDVWVPDLIRIMQSVGIRIGKVGVEKPAKAGYKTPMRFAIKMQSWIDSGCRFNIARKQDRVNLWASIGPYERRALHPRGGPQRLCEVAGCGVKYLAKGLCNRHYKQAQAKLRDYTPSASLEMA